LAHLPGGEGGGHLQVAQLTAEGLAEAVHARLGAGEVGAVALEAGLAELLGAVVIAAAAATGVGAADLPLIVDVPAQAEVQGPGVDVDIALAAGDVLIAHGRL